MGVGNEEGGKPTEGPVSLQAQLDLVKNTSKISGIREFANALVLGKLPDLLPLHIVDAKSLANSFMNAAPRIREETWGRQIDYWMGLADPKLLGRSIHLTVPIRSDGKVNFTLSGYLDGDPNNRDLATKNKGLHAECEFELDEVGRPKLKLKGGLVYVQTSTGDLAYDRLMVVGSNGYIQDILRPGDYHNERLYGATVRLGESLVRGKKLPLPAIHDLDQMEALLEEDGTKLAHQRGPNTYRGLEGDIASFYGKTPDELKRSRVDLVRTLEATLNLPLNTRPAIHGQGTISVPPLVFV